MSTIERRSTVVPLYQGAYAQRLADLLDETMAKQRAAEAAEADEESAGPRRVGQVSLARQLATEAKSLAKQYDDLLAEAETRTVKVTLWEISYRHWSGLRDEHPPRDDDRRDATFGMNMKTFPSAVLRASLVPSDQSANITDLTRLVALGQSILDELGDISGMHYAKLEKAAWDMNVEDDALPKFSLVSLLTEASASDSTPPPASE